MVTLLGRTIAMHEMKLGFIEKSVGMLMTFTAHGDCTSMFTFGSIIVMVAFRLPGGSPKPRFTEQLK